MYQVAVIGQYWMLMMTIVMHLIFKTELFFFYENENKMHTNRFNNFDELIFYFWFLM